MNFFHWLCSILTGRKKGYNFKFPIGFQKKKKRMALFGVSHFKNGGRIHE